MKIKYIIKKVFLGILSMYVIIIAKNIYLYSTYKHGEAVFTKNENDNMLAGNWKVEFETFCDGRDQKHTEMFSINADSTGILSSKDQFAKILGASANYYSFMSLLPYKSSEMLGKRKVKFDSQYVMYMRERISPKNKLKILTDTLLFRKYKLSSGSLYVDMRNYQNSRYDEKPNWIPKLSEKHDFWDLFTLIKF